MTWEDELKAIAPRARRRETLADAAREAFQLARRQPEIAQRIRVKLAWHRIRGLASSEVAPPWERLLDDLEHAPRMQALITALADEPDIAAAAAHLLSLYAHPEDADALVEPALEAARAKDEARAGAARALVSRLGDVAPARMAREIDALLASRKKGDVAIGIVLARSSAGASRRDDLAARLVECIVAAEPTERRVLLARLAARPGTSSSHALLREVARRLETEGALDDDAVEDARRHVRDLDMWLAETGS